MRTLGRIGAERCAVEKFIREALKMRTLTGIL